ncbi:virulence factor MVIN family protein [Candidatus Vecturithrix granuli]|uniref:Virulence factor MVIN family protein n=1 Tax=Vecturithrix granuli TaxID=1499967 RepID=A0A081BY51_VECG1|nr:virulence factor MVIN family protein [Candidatus Vecturithrix granuli]
MLSFVKSFIIAAYYGTSAELDAYFLALAPFNLILGIAAGAIQAALIPKYSELSIKQGKQYAFSFLATFLMYIIGGVIMIIGIFWWKSFFLASQFGTRFSDQQVTLMASFLKMTTLLLVFAVFNTIGSALFNAHQKFLLSASLPLAGGILSVGYIIFFRDQGVVSLMYGLLIGLAAQSCLMGGIAQRFFSDCSLTFFSLRHPEIRKTGKILSPLILGGMLGHANIIIDQMMASMLPAGSISALQYASRLHSVFTQMFVMVVSNAALPFFAQQVAQNDLHALKATFFQVAKRTLLFLLPLSLGILLFGNMFVKLAFQRGAFSVHSTLATAGAWKAYTLGLPVMAVGILATKIFNSLQENTILMYISAGNIVLNIGLNWLFMSWWGHIGIALSTTGVYCVATGMVLYLLHKKIDLFA